MVLDLMYINYLKDNRKVFLGCSSFNNKCVLCAPGKGLQRGALITLAEVGGSQAGSVGRWLHGNCKGGSEATTQG